MLPARGYAAGLTAIHSCSCQVSSHEKGNQQDVAAAQHHLAQHNMCMQQHDRHGCMQVCIKYVCYRPASAARDWGAMDTTTVMPGSRSLDRNSSVL
jgi:hypothetical protein